MHAAPYTGGIRHVQQSDRKLRLQFSVFVSNVILNYSVLIS